MDKKEGGSQMTRMLTRNSVHHSCRMCNQVKSKGKMHLLLGEVGACVPSLSGVLQQARWQIGALPEQR